MSQPLTIDSLLALGRTGDPDPFINLATATLANGVQCDELRVLLMRRLAERGLLHRAAATGEGLSAELRTSTDYAEMLRTLQASTGDGRVPWAHMAAQFDANLQVLTRRYAWADQAESTWAAARHKLELHVTNDGAFQVFDRRAGADGLWRPAFGNHVPQPAADELARQCRNHVLAPLVIEGVDLGYHLPWLRAATSNTLLGASPVIYQIECSWLALAVALHLNDWREALADERVRLCCGPDAYEQFEHSATSDPWRTPPALTLHTSSWEPRADRNLTQRMEKLAAQCESQRVTRQASVQAGYRGRDSRWWHKRFAAALAGAGPPLRVLGVTSRFTTVLQYSMRDALNGFKANGCETRLLIEPDNHSLITPARVLETIREFQPDLLLLLDHTRARQRDGLIDHVPVVTWVQDRLPWLFERATGAALGPLDFCMGFHERELVQDYGYPADRFFPCGMATDPDALFPPASEASGRESSAGRDEPDDARLRCDVAYATHHSQTPAEFHADYRRGKDPSVRSLVDASYEELVSRARDCVLDGGLDATEFVAGMEQAAATQLTARQRTALAADFVRPLADRLLRHQTVEWAARWAEETGRRLHLYGNGWESHPRFARHARGFLPHGFELGRAFRAAKVHLHAGCNIATHQRVLDGLAAGGFFLIRRHECDVHGLLWFTMHDIVQRKGLRAGDRICWSKELPAALLDEFSADRRRRGLDPFETTVIQQENLDNCRRYRESMAYPSAAALWPDYHRVVFRTQTELVDKLEWFLVHEEERRALAAAMRPAVLERFTYKALMRRLLDWLTACLNPASPARLAAGPVTGHSECQQSVEPAEVCAR